MASAIALVAIVCVVDTAGQAKSPGEIYCYNDARRRVRTLRETESLVGQHLKFKASYYDHCQRDRFNPCRLTSSGEYFRADVPDNAASPDLPDGTLLLLFHAATQKAAVVRINNAGPYHSDRQLDVSRATAEALGFRERGLALLDAVVLRAPSPSEAQYQRQRQYDPVAGLIGTFATLAAAQASLAQAATRVEPEPDASAPELHLSKVFAMVPMPVMPTTAPQVVFTSETPIVDAISRAAPELALATTAPAMNVAAAAAPFEDAKITASIVAGLPPLAARILFGLPPRFATAATHHPSIDDRSGSERAERPGTRTKAAVAQVETRPELPSATAVAGVNSPVQAVTAWLTHSVTAATPRAATWPRLESLLTRFRSAEQWDLERNLYAARNHAIERARPFDAHTTADPSATAQTARIQF